MPNVLLCNSDIIFKEREREREIIAKLKINPTHESKTYNKLEEE